MRLTTQKLPAPALLIVYGDTKIAKRVFAETQRPQASSYERLSKEASSGKSQAISSAHSSTESQTIGPRTCTELDAIAWDLERGYTRIP
jgi:hypothetical protein